MGVEPGLSHEVKLDVFQGPIELLLHLITRRRVDIYDVSLAEITDEYLTAMAAMETTDLEAATGFLVVAATLMEMKSARLLPAYRLDAGNGRLLEERDLLLARLVECATYREAGSWFRGRLAAGELFHARSVSMEPEFVGLMPDLLSGIAPRDLGATAARMLAPRPQVELDISHLEPIRASVRAAIADIAGHLEAFSRADFSDLCTNQPRIEVVVRFLALLELFKAGAIDLDQDGRWGEVSVKWTGTVTVDDVVEGTEEYELQPFGGER
jgi:segregation and condensation protein A